jgi:sugar lactone lactonase YvrE
LIPTVSPLVAYGDASLGGSALWSPAEGAFYFVDIKTPRLLRHDLAAGTTRITALPEPVGLGAAALAQAPCSGSVLVVRTEARGLPEPYFAGQA